MHTLMYTYINISETFGRFNVCDNVFDQYIDELGS